MVAIYNFAETLLQIVLAISGNNSVAMHNIVMLGESFECYYKVTLAGLIYPNSVECSSINQS